MADLILTQKEKDSASYLDWSDEATGKAVKSTALEWAICTLGSLFLIYRALLIFAVKHLNRSLVVAWNFSLKALLAMMKVVAIGK